jgi:septin family protein
MQQIKLFYSIECLLVMQRPILVCGEGAAGKSTFVKDLIFNQVNVFTKQLLADHLTCSTYSTAFTFKDHFERSLETQKTNEQIEYLGDSDTEIPMKSSKTKSNNASRPGTAETNLDGLFRKVLEWDQEPVKMRPEGINTHVVFYIEDLHMA